MVVRRPQHGFRHSLLLSAQRFYLPILLMVAAVSALVDGTGPLYPLDLHLIGASGTQLLSGEWRTAFSDPTVQAGPLQALLWGVILRTASFLGSRDQVIFSLVSQTSVVLAAAVAFRVVSSKRAHQVVEASALVLLILWGIPWRAYASGHPEEVWIGVLWLIAAATARDDRPVLAGVLIGFAAGIKPWGVLGIPLMAMAHSRRDFLVGAGAAVGVSFVLYGPFLAFGTVHTFDYSWPIESSSTLSLLGFSGHFSWLWRLLQAGVVSVAGFALILRFRRHSTSIWLVPAQMIAARLLLDPLNVEYYWLPVVVLLTVGVVLLWDSNNWPTRTALTLPLYLLVVALTGPRALLLWVPFGAIGLFSLVVGRTASLGSDPGGRIAR